MRRSLVSRPYDLLSHFLAKAGSVPDLVLPNQFPVKVIFLNISTACVAVVLKDFFPVEIM